MQYARHCKKHWRALLLFYFGSICVFVHSQTAAEHQLQIMRNQLDEERMKRMRHAAMTGRDWVEYLARKRESATKGASKMQPSSAGDIANDNFEDGDYNQFLESDEYLQPSSQKTSDNPTAKTLGRNFSRTAGNAGGHNIGENKKLNPYDDFAAPPIEQVDTSPDPPQHSIPTSLNDHERGERVVKCAAPVFEETNADGSQLVPYGNGVEQFVSDNESGPANGDLDANIRQPSSAVLAAKSRKYSSTQQQLASAASCHLAKKRRRFDGHTQMAHYSTNTGVSLFSSDALQRASFSSCCKKKKKKKCGKKKKKKLKCLIEDKESVAPPCRREPCCPKQVIKKDEGKVKMVCEKRKKDKKTKKKSKCKKQKRDPCCKPPKKQRVKDSSCGGECPKLPKRKPPKKKKLKCKKLKHKCDDKPESCCQVTKEFDCCQSHDKAKELKKREEED